MIEFASGLVALAEILAGGVVLIYSYSKARKTLNTEIKEIQKEAILSLQSLIDAKEKQITDLEKKNTELDEKVRFLEHELQSYAELNRNIQEQFADFRRHCCPNGGTGG